MNYFNPEIQLKDTLSSIKQYTKTTLALVLKKIESGDKTKYEIFYSPSKAEKIINESDIDDVFESLYYKFIWNIQKSLGKS